MPPPLYQLHPCSEGFRRYPEWVIVTFVGFVVAVVATPATEWKAVLLYAGILIGAAYATKIPFTRVLKGFALEAPILFTAATLPFLGRGNRVDFGGLSLSETGLVAAWTVLCKGTLSTVAAVIAGSAIGAAGFVRGLERLRLPAIFLEITAFMFRYGHILNDSWHRMSIAQRSRGSEAATVRWYLRIRRMSHGVGSLFLRAFERGERVHQAMASRGYRGYKSTKSPQYIR